MSYPEAKYLGAGGDVSARLRSRSEPPELVNSQGGTVEYLATGAGTNGEFGLYRWTFGTGRGGPDAHFHRTIGESFYILSGVVQLYDGADWVSAEAGDFLYVPQGGVHGFRNETEGASMLILFTPGAPREEYFEWLVEIGRGERTLTDEERTEFYLRHDTYWV